MRGLTPVERFVLAPNAETSGSLTQQFTPTTWFDARIALWRNGRMWSPIAGGATDLGRLALRVCPVDE